MKLTPGLLSKNPKFNKVVSDKIVRFDNLKLEDFSMKILIIQLRKLVSFFPISLTFDKKTKDFLFLSTNCWRGETAHAMSGSI